MAMEIVESDAVDAMPQEESKNAPKADPKPVKQFRDEAPKKPKLEPSTTPPVEIEGQGGQWSIKVTTDLDATVEQWAAAAGDAVQIALTQAQNLDDVVSIFRVNRTIFERMQADVKPKYDELMKLFATHKAKFKEKEEA
jgi:hypothetical protein